MIHKMIVLTLILASSALAQEKSTAYINQQRQVDETVRLQLDRQLPASQKVLVDFGGWYTSYVYLFDDGIKNRTLRQQDFRLWGSLSADDAIHQAYARMRMSYFDFNHGDSYTGNEDDLEGPSLDRG